VALLDRSRLGYDSSATYYFSNSTITIIFNFKFLTA
jgi:hypothetical protein